MRKSAAPVEGNLHVIAASCSEEHALPLRDGSFAPGDGRNAAPWKPLSHSSEVVNSLGTRHAPDRVCSVLWQDGGVVVVAHGMDIGRVQLSVETADTADDRVNDAYDYLLTAAERRTVDRLPPDQRHALVTRLWVRKDAALRLLGHGLAGYPHRMHAYYRGAQGTIRVADPEDAQLQYVIHLSDFAVPTGQVLSVASWSAPRGCHAWHLRTAEPADPTRLLGGRVPSLEDDPAFPPSTRAAFPSVT